jgi:hypothetical protein
MVLMHGERCWGTPKRTLNTLKNNKFKPLHKQKKKINYSKMISKLMLIRTLGMFFLASSNPI